MNEREAESRLAQVWVRITTALMRWTLSIKNQADYQREIEWVVERMEELAAKIESRAAGAVVVVDPSQVRELPEREDPPP